MKKILSAAVIALSMVLLMNSCVSYEIDEEADFGELYEFQGIRILTDDANDARVAAVLRNDNPYEVEVTFRTIGGKIGNQYFKSNYAVGSPSSGGEYTASWIISDQVTYLLPGEEVLTYGFLKNWYVANKPFKSRIEVIVRSPGIPSRLTIRFDDSNVFSDPWQIFQENKLGRNVPGKYASRAKRFDDPPRDYELTIPE